MLDWNRYYFDDDLIWFLIQSGKISWFLGYSFAELTNNMLYCLHRDSSLHTVPLKSLDTPSLSMIFLNFYYFLHCRSILKKFKLRNKLCSKQKIVKTRICFIISILQSSYLLLWWQLCTLLAFSQSDSGLLKGFQRCWFASGCGLTHPKPFQLGLGMGIVEDRSSVAALNPSPSWSDSYYTDWSCVWGHCLVEKQIMVQLSVNQMGWHVAVECCGSHAG